MGRLFVGSLHITVDGPRQSAPAITRECAEPETLGHADASGREISAPDKRTRSNVGQPGSYQFARWVSTDKRASSDYCIAGEKPTSHY